jgi:hypothetical protein
VRCVLNFAIIIFAAFLVLVSFAISAGSENEPEITDPQGDVRLIGAMVAGATVAPPIMGDCVDIICVWFGNETNDSVSVTMKLNNLNNLTLTDSDPVADTMYIVDFHTSYSERSYEARADYFNGGKWAYMIGMYESDSDTTMDDFPTNGSVDIGASTVTIIIPKSLMGNPLAGDLLTKMQSTAQTVYCSDWAPDSTQDYGKDYKFTTGSRANISVNCTAEKIDAKPGDNISFMLTVRNDGSEKTKVSLSLRGPEGWICSFENKNLEIMAHTRNLTKLNVHVPNNAVNETVKFTIITSSASEASSCDVFINVVEPEKQGDKKAPSGKWGDITHYYYCC